MLEACLDRPVALQSAHVVLMECLMIARSTFAVLVAGFVSQPSLLWAEDGSWLTEQFDVVVRDQPVSDVLREFGVMVGRPVVVTEGVDGRVSIRFDSATGSDILDAVTRENALDWRYDGVRIEVSSHDEQVSRLLQMGGVQQEDLVAALDAIKVYDSKFPISTIDGTLALVSGPPRYIAIVEIVLGQLVERRLVAELEAEERAAAESAAKVEAEKLAEARRLAEMKRQEEAARRVDQQALQAQEQALRLAAAREEIRLRAIERAAIAQERELERLRARAARGPVVVRGLATGS